MANPQVYGPDGVLRTVVIFSTSVDSRFISGTLPEETYDAQVSINGAGFSSDPSLILWGDGSWVVPNPASEPDGLSLLPGANIVEVRAILPSGSTTPSARAEIRHVTTADVGIVASPPTNISVEQKNQSVVINAEPLTTTGFRGMNYYASVSGGGGSTGYFRINLNTVSSGTPVEDVTEFASLSVDALVAVDIVGTPLADPLYFRLTGQQEDTNEVVLSADFSERWVVPESARTVRVSSVLQSVRPYVTYPFEHFRSAGAKDTPATIRVGDFATLSSETPLYYVVTAVYYDSTQNLEYESSFSEEVVGHPTQITTALATPLSPTRQIVTQQFISSVRRSNPQIKVEAGSVLRDTVIDPFSSESERIRFVLDFFQRARTPVLLLQIDDPTLSGNSVPVSSSPYKQALKQAFYLNTAGEVQGMIDGAFESYASNFGKTRRNGVSAQGAVLFYTTTRPNQSVIIPLGTTVSGNGRSFTTTRAASIPLDKLASYYDPVSGRYQIAVPVRAAAVGSSSNLGVGQIRSLNSNLGFRISVTNISPMVGGKDVESNLDLVNRLRNVLASVDSGTKQGYLQTAADTAGVVKANVVAAGDPLMIRDLDSSGVHKGGKVDVWVQGTNISTVTDTFAFTYVIAQDIQFELVGSPANLQFRAVDPNLSADNPIVEMLDNATIGYEFRNASTGLVFDLTGVTIDSFDTISLSTAVYQPPVSLSDVVIGSYRRRQGNVFVLPRQPVTAISSVVGTVSGQIPSSSVVLVHPNSPLYTGRSLLAGDYLEILSYTDLDGNTIPSGAQIQVTNEPHVLLGGYPEYVDNLGANFLSVQVWNSTRTILYAGPDDPSGNPDYTITVGTQTQALSITRVETGTIPSGASVSVDYEHDENFTVTYTTNLIVSLTQQPIDVKKHATADVLVKDAVPIPLDIDATVVLVKGRSKATVDTTIRTNMANFFQNLRLGDPVRQSDIIDVIEQSAGVSYVVVPLTKMVPSLDAEIVREQISTDTVSESVFLASLTTNLAVVFILTNELEFATVDGGGIDGDFRSVTQNDIALNLLDATESLSSLGLSPGRAYVIGNEGRSILGYSDDATLISEGYVTPTAITNQRAILTANHVLVSLPIGKSPTEYNYAATYVVGTDSGAKNVDPNDAQYVSEGNVMLTYDEDV